jgi:para-nitrobenzyl esterase
VSSSCGGSAPLLDRRKFLVRGSMTVAAIAGATSLTPRLGFAQETTTEYAEVATAYGRLRGLRQEGLVTFKGIPYAGPVSGASRFKAAPPLQPWTGVRDALRLGAPSWQPGKGYWGINEPPPDENCLFLNVWTPAADGRKRPVMFYNHGGGFFKGSGGAAYQDGGNLARTYDVVVVTTNHRLGLFGYLFLADLGGSEFETSGNQGLLDIKDGLKWVHENIEAFGGDPNNVMIFGESGGGLKTSCLYALPSAEKYFHKASIESGPGMRMMTRDEANETTRKTLTQLGLEKSEWRKLLEAPVDKLVAAEVVVGRPPAASFPLSESLKGNSWMMGGPIAPVVDGNVFPHHPFDPEAPAISRNKPLIVGSNRDEMLFAWFQYRNDEVLHLTNETLKARLDRELGAKAGTVLATYRKTRPNASPLDLYTAIVGACTIWMPAIWIAERKYAQHGAPVYMYMFTHESTRIIPGTHHTLGAAHALEIPYKFDNLHPGGEERPPDVPQPGSIYGMDTIVGSHPDRAQTAHNMSEMWSTFARTGHPAAKGQPVWPAYTTETRATMLINAECKVARDPFAEERIMLEHLDS